MEDSVLAIQVYGRVQGVGFRYYCCRKARSLTLKGWVRNEADGSVSVHVQGDQACVDDLCRWLKKGPPSGRVDSVHIKPARFQADLADFDIEY